MEKRVLESSKDTEMSERRREKATEKAIEKEMEISEV